MALTYRMSTENDEPALIRLWSEHSGWGNIDAESWDQLLLKPPFGAAAIALATDSGTGEIIAQLPFIPSLVVVDGREVSALRPFAPIFAKSARQRMAITMVHPVVKLYWHAVDALRGRGDGLIYMLPDPRWVRFLRPLPYMHCGSFPLWSRPLPLVLPQPLGDGYRVGPRPVWDQRVDRLWASASHLYGCSVVRDSRTMPWRMGREDYTVTAVERGRDLVGLVASRQKGVRQWLICDLLVADNRDALRATLAAAVNVGHAAAVAADLDRPIRKVAVLATPRMEPALRDLGFAPDAYDFPFMVHILDETISKESIAPSRWYLSASD